MRETHQQCSLSLDSTRTYPLTLVVEPCLWVDHDLCNDNALTARNDWRSTGGAAWPGAWLDTGSRRFERRQWRLGGRRSRRRLGHGRNNDGSTLLNRRWNSDSIGLATRSGRCGGRRRQWRLGRSIDSTHGCTRHNQDGRWSLGDGGCHRRLYGSQSRLGRLDGSQGRRRRYLGRLGTGTAFEVAPLSNGTNR